MIAKLGPGSGSDLTICFCYSVSQSTIGEAFLKGARTIDAIREKTGANTGCGGCETEICELLDQWDQWEKTDGLKRNDP